MTFKVGDVVRHCDDSVDALLAAGVQPPAYGVVVGEPYLYDKEPFADSYIVPVAWYDDRGDEVELPIPYDTHKEWEELLILSPLSIVENLHEVQGRRRSRA